MEWLLVLPVLVAIAIPIATLRIESWQIIPFLMLLIGQVTALIGYVLLDSRTGRLLSMLFALSVLSLFVGYLIQRRKATEAVAVAAVAADPTTLRALYIFWAVIVGFVVYHFAVGGIPLFSPEIDTRRFEFAASGLLGIPGRMFLYGLKFLVFFVAAVRFRGDGGSLRGLWVPTWVIFGAAWILAGFKSAIISVAVVALFALSLAGRDLRLTRRMTVSIAAVVVSGLAFFMFLSFRLPGAQVESIPDAFVYVLERPTVLEAEAGYFALNELPDEPGSYLVTDTLYFLNKYLGFNLGDEPRFPLEQVVSANLNHVPLSEDSFIVPVTVGAFAAVEADFGPIAALLAMAILGWTFRYMLLRGRRANTAFSAASWCFGAYMVTFFITRGGLAYTVINGAAVLVFLLLVWLGCRAIVGLFASARGVRRTVEVEDSGT